MAVLATMKKYMNSCETTGPEALFEDETKITEAEFLVDRPFE